MQTLTLTNCIAACAGIAVLINLWNTTGKPKQKMFKVLVCAAIVIATFIFTKSKNQNDVSASLNAIKKSDSLNTKLDTLNSYIRKLNAKGIIRDSVTNEPDLSIFIDNSKSKHNVTSNGQNGGQTADRIDNIYK